MDLGGNQADLVRWSLAAARELLAGVGTRLAHIEAVGRRAEEVSGVLPVEDRVALVAAAYLHDVGYTPALRVTGLHPLDGARWLRSRGVEGRVCNLVAHHSGARFEAEEGGLLVELEEFDLETGPVMDALVFFGPRQHGVDGAEVYANSRPVSEAFGSRQCA